MQFFLFFSIKFVFRFGEYLGDDFDLEILSRLIQCNDFNNDFTERMNLIWQMIKKIKPRALHPNVEGVAIGKMMKDIFGIIDPLLLREIWEFQCSNTYYFLFYNNFMVYIYQSKVFYTPLFFAPPPSAPPPQTVALCLSKKLGVGV